MPVVPAVLLVALVSATTGAPAAGGGERSARTYLHVPSWTDGADLVVLTVVEACEHKDGQLQATGRVREVLKGKWDGPDIRFGVSAVVPVGVSGLAFLVRQDPGFVSFCSYGVLGPEVPLLVVRTVPPPVGPAVGLARIRQLLEATVTSSVDDARLVAAEQLGFMARRRATTALLARLAGERGADLSLRGACVASLLRLREPDAVPLAVDFLEAARDDHDAQDQRGSVVYELANTTPACADVDALARLAGDRKAHVREACVAALGRTLDPQAIPVLIPLLADPEQSVRRRVAEALAGLTGDREHGNCADYATQEERILGYWRQWWRTEGQPAFAVPAAEGRR